MSYDYNKKIIRRQVDKAIKDNNLKRVRPSIQTITFLTRLQDKLIETLVVEGYKSGLIRGNLKAETLRNLIETEEITLKKLLEGGLREDEV